MKENSDNEIIGKPDEEVAIRERSRGLGSTRNYIVLPLIFLAVTLLGGLRLNANDNAFIFLKPALVCLVFASVTIVLFLRARLIEMSGWFSHESSNLRNAANVAIAITLFTATTQVFNSLLPEQGLTFWVMAFCFFWTLWTNLFAEFEVQKLMRSLAAMFGLAFVVKYLLLANLTLSTGGSWLQRMMENPAQESLAWLLDLPRYSSGTGYLQFFTLVLYLIGLYLTPQKNAPTKA